jgi:hypothetical protein
VRGAGDVNGDAIDDLIIGAPYAAPDGRDNAGASYVVFGTDQGFPPIIDLADGTDLIIQGAEPGDASGRSVSEAGDVNGDGIDDLIIGAFAASPNGREYAGASYVVFGSDRGFAATIDLATDADLIMRGTPNDFAGARVDGAGDINGDGFDDLIVVAPDASAKRPVYVVFGGPTAAIKRLITRVEAADLWGGRRLEESLTRKLGKAEKHATQDNFTRAISWLRAFIDKVKRNRGDGIDRADAKLWIANARAIIDTLRDLRERSPEAREPKLSSMVLMR